MRCGVRGPPVLLIMGASGDAAHFATVAEDLADEFTAVTYDRRGNSRSPRPPGWSATSVEEQADDAEALVAGARPGSRSGHRHQRGRGHLPLPRAPAPAAVRGAVIHEPALWSVLPSPEPQAAIAALAREGMAAGGPAAAMEAFWRFVAGDDGWEALGRDLRDRMGANAETFFGLERASYAAWRPSDEALRAVAVPVQVLAGDRTRPFFTEMAAWLAERLGVEVTTTPGTHAPYHDHPQELARAIRPFLRRVAGSG